MKIVPKKNNDVVVLFGDVPLVKKSTIKRLIKYKKTSKSKGVIVTFVANNPFGYGRVIIEKNKVKDIIEQKDASKIQQSCSDRSLLVVERGTFLSSFQMDGVYVICGRVCAFGRMYKLNIHGMYTLEKWSHTPFCPDSPIW